MLDSSRDSDSIIPFLCSLLGVANPYPPASSDDSGARAPGGSGFSVSATPAVASGWSPGLRFSAPSSSANVSPGVSVAVSGSVASGVASLVACGVASSVAGLVSSGGGSIFGLSGLSVPSGGVPPLVSQSFPSSFTPWTSSLVTLSSPWSFLSTLVSSVAPVSSTLVSLAGNLNLSQPSPCVVGGGMSSSLAVAGSCFAMSSILAPVSTVVSSCGMSSGVSVVSWSSPLLVSSVPPVALSFVTGSVPSVPGVGVVSGVALTVWGGGGGLWMFWLRIRIRLLFLRLRVWLVFLPILWYLQTVMIR